MIFFQELKTPSLITKNFTLIEFLVVVAILSILFTLLQPSIKKAVLMAQTTACQNNLKQIGVAYQMYPEDFDGWLAKGGNMVWEYELKDYLGVTFPEKKSQYRTFNAKSTIFECPTYTYNEDIAPPLYGGYAFNTINLGNTKEEQRIHRSKLEVPSETLAIGDGMNYIENNKRFHILYIPSYIPWHSQNGYGDFVYTRHDIGLNLVWTDGHASYENWFELKAGRNNDVNYYYRVIK